MLATNTTYEFSLEEVKKVIAKELNIEPEKMKIEAVTESYGDERCGTNYNKVTGVKVTIKLLGAK